MKRVLLLVCIAGISAGAGGRAFAEQPRPRRPFHAPPPACPLPGSGSANRLLALRLAKTLNDPRLSTGFVGMCVEDEGTGTVIFEQNADRVFMPASNNKLLTAFALLEAKPNLRYTTRVYADGTRNPEGTLKGTLVLVGEGDPSLSVESLRNLAKQAAALGIKTVTGGIQYDESRFDEQKLGDSWSWDDEPFSYSAQVSGLNCNENTVKVTLYLQDGAAAASLSPPSEDVIVLNRVRLLPPSKPILRPVTFLRKRGQNLLEIDGELHESSLLRKAPAQELTVENPAHFTASLFRGFLREAGVTVLGGISRLPISFWSQPFPPSQAIASVSSESLPKLLSDFLKPSDNLYGECFLKTVGLDPVTFGGGSIERGVKATEPRFLKAGLSLSRLRIVDGSGLSQHNLVSPRSLVRLLRYIRGRPYAAMFDRALPVAGKDGTLRNRMKGTPAAGNVHAKTGTLTYASSLSGYVTARGGRRLVFSILMNHYLCSGSAAREVQDRLAVLLASEGR